MRSVAAIAAAVVSLVGVGCGGEPQTHSDFGREAAGICEGANARVRQVWTSAAGHDTPETALRMLDTLREALADLRDLEQPKPDRARIEKWVAVVDQMVDEAELARAADIASDVVAFDDATERATLLDERARVLARELDVKEPCRLPVPLRERATTESS